MWATEELEDDEEDDLQVQGLDSTFYIVFQSHFFKYLFIIEVMQF